MCRQLGISLNNKNWMKWEIEEVRKYLEKRSRKESRGGAINNNLKYIISHEITELMRYRSYRGLRHSNRLPVRGQRTSTNMKTIKRVKSIPKWV